MKYFITQQDIKDNTTVQQNLDAALLLPFIPLAQDKHIRKILSTGLHNRLMAYVQTYPDAATVFPMEFPVGLADDFVRDALLDKLLTELKQAHIYWTLVEALPFLYVKITNKGLMNKGEGVDSHQYKSLDSSFRSTADHYSDELIKFLEKNAADYPGYQAPKSDSVTKLLAGVCFD